MARTPRDVKLSSRTARSKLTARANPHWQTIAPGQQVGYLKGKRANSWLAKYRDPDTGERTQRRLGSADDHAETDGELILTYYQAAEAARAFFAECQRGEPGAAARGPYTVADAIADYLANMRQRGAKSASDTRNRLEAHALPELGEIEVAKLTAKRLRAWQRNLVEKPPRRRTRKGELQRHAEMIGDPDEPRRRRASANRTMTALKAALNHAWREGKVPSDDVWRRVTPFKQADAARLRYLSTDEIARLVNTAEGSFRRLIQAALYTGARYGELTRMVVADFNPDAGTVEVRESKSGKARHIVLTGQGIAFFELAAAGRDATALLFPRANGGAWTSSQQQRPMREACERAGIVPPATFHAIRHSYASHLAMQGVPFAVIAANLGHADQRMVEKHYGHLAPSYVADTIRRVGLGYDVPGDDSTVTPMRRGGNYSSSD